MKIITAPEIYELEPDEFSIFMAGGITGCPDWQAEVISMLSKKDFKYKDKLVLFNPRRPNFDTSRNEDSDEQIRWEHRYLNSTDEVYFWFPKEGLCQITLFELGMMSGRGNEIQVGCHPEYARAFDVHTQMRLYDPGLRIYDNLEELYGF